MAGYTLKLSVRNKNNTSNTSTSTENTSTSKNTSTSATTSSNKNTSATSGNSGAIVKVNSDGKAPSGLKAGDQVVTAAGTYTINSVNSDGSYKSTLTNKNQTTNNYTGTYSTGGSGTTSAKGYGTTAATAVNGVYSTQNGAGSVVRETTDQGLLGKGQTHVSGYVGDDDGLYYKPYTNYSNTTTSYADEGLLSDAAYAKVQQYKQDWQTAYEKGDTAGMEAAHAAAEAVRASYGYSGGTNGGAYNKYVLGTEENPTNLQKAGWTTSSGFSSGSSQNNSSSNSSTSTGNGSGATSGNNSTESGTHPSASATVNDYSDYLQKLYEAKLESNLAALKSAYEKNVNTLDAAQESIAPQYESARNQAASAAAVSQRNFHQYASASGLNSGTGAQAQLANNVALQNNLNSVNTAESQALSDLELQRTTLATEYENAIVQAKADGDYQLADALYQEAVRVDEAIQAQTQYLNNLALQQQQFALQQQQFAFNQQQYADSLTQQDKQWAFQQQQYADSLAQQNREWNLTQQKYNDSLSQQDKEWDFTQQKYQDSLNQYNNSLTQSNSDTQYERGLELAQYLYQATGDASGFASYGYTDAQIAALESQWKLKNATTTTGTSTSSISSGRSYSNGSLTTDQVKELQTYYGVTADGKWGSNSKSAAGGLSADQAWKKYTKSSTSSTNSNTLTSEGQTILYQLQHIPGLTQENKTAIIQTAYNQGKGRITARDVSLLLSYLGY